MNPPISPTPAADELLLATPPPSTSPSKAELAVSIGLDDAVQYTLEHGEYVIGRDASCHIVLDADGVSRRHARLTFSSYELVIEDLESSNGVFIEGVQVQLATRVRPEQEVQIGPARLTVRLSEATARQFTDALWDADLGLAPIRQQLEGAKYRVLTTVARGGMGVIMQARDMRIRRTVAMKVMKSGAQFSKENVLRFIDEAQLTGQLEHPNIVPVYELGLDGHGETFYTMKFVKGITLDVVLRGLRSGDPLIRAKYSLGMLLTIFQKIADAVAYAHSRGVIHRDLKPENVMIGSYGEVLVMDWGLAKQVSSGRDEPSDSDVTIPVFPKLTLDQDRGFQTMHGVVVGTPPYISPEQARGELDSIDPRSDIYVLGAILYAVLTLRPPVWADSVDQVLEKILESKIERPVHFNSPKRRRDRLPPGSPSDGFTLDHCPGGRIPEGLSAVAMKALRVDPADRYQTVEEMQADITAFQGGFATKAEKATPWRQTVLFAGRHKREMAMLVIFTVLLQGLSVAFALRTNSEKNRAIDSEERMKQSQKELAKALDELRGTAPTFAQEAAALLDRQQPEAALEKIDYALEQLPNELDYLLLRANTLQTLLRFPEAQAVYEEIQNRVETNLKTRFPNGGKGYEEALKKSSHYRIAGENLQITLKLVEQLNKEGQPTPVLLRTLHRSLISQKRVGEALYVLDQIGKDKTLFFQTWRAAMEKRGMVQRFQTEEDETISVDLGKVKDVDLSKLRGIPVSSLLLDDTRVYDLSALKGQSLRTLSLNRVPVTDLSPLVGMPLRRLYMDNVPARTLDAIARAPLEILRVSGMQIRSLDPLRGMKLEQLNLSGCREVRDVSPLKGMPLQTVDLSKTRIDDLTPLVNSPIRELNLEGCTDLVNLKPLLEMKSLEGVLIPAQCKNVDFLKDHPSLKRLSYKKLTQPVYEFWEEYDAKKAAGEEPK